MHAAIWDLRKELPTPHREGRCFEVPVWRLGEKVVCRNTFVVVTGGTPNSHREALTSTIAGTCPTDGDVNGVKAASQAVKSLQTTRYSQRRFNVGNFMVKKTFDVARLAAK